MSQHRYNRRDLNADYLRAGLGCAACIVPVFFLAPGAAATYVLAVPAVFFALFAVRTWKNAHTEIDMNSDGIAAQGGATAEIRWDALERVKLSYFSTRRDREAGWLQLKLHGSGSALTLHSSLDGFEEICQAAYRAAVARNLDLTDATARNFAELGLGAPARPVDPTPAALSGWGNPADWRR